MIPELTTKAIANNTLKSYAQGYRNWTTWSRQFPETDVLPVKGFHLALFITATIQTSGKYGNIEQAFYGLNWLHKTLNLPNPCESNTVKTIKEAAKRILSKPVIKKQPVSPDNLRELTKKLGKSAELVQMRTLTMALLSYAGFFRYDEVHRIRREHINFLSRYMKIFVPSSKRDQHNVGDYVYIARTGRSTCPYKALRKYLGMAKITRSDKVYVFRAATRTKAGAYLKQINWPISYTTARKNILSAIDSIGLNKKLFGTHSFRRGGATHSCRNGISDRLFKKHGRWRSDNAKDGYVSEDLETKLTVSRNLEI